MELAVLTGGGWLMLLGLVLTLMAAASRADSRSERMLADREAAGPQPASRSGPLGFTQRKPERKLPGRERPGSEKRVRPR